MRKHLLIPIIALFSQGIMGQTSVLTGLSFPSVNNSFLGKSDPISSIGSIPSVGVDYYSGSAQVSVPICKLASTQLTIPVSVDYVDGRGVKVQEYASQVGLGWQLNAGGAISRVVRGFPDEMPNGYLGTGTQPTIIPGVPVLPAGQRWGQLAVSAATVLTQVTSQTRCFLGFDNNGVPSTPTADGEPDLFYVKTPFFSFEFVFNSSGQPVFLNNSGYKIVTTNFFNTPKPACLNPSFEVIDDQGNQFYFGSSTASTEQSTDSIYNVSTPFISTWYLDKIVTYNSRDVINLTYQAGLVSDVTYHYSWVEVLNPSGTTTTSTGQTILAQPKYVSTISSSLGEIDFSYVTNGRQDDPTAFQLSSVVLKAYNPQTSSNSTTLQTYNFSYSYFGVPSTDPNVLRLQLNGITMTGNTSPTSAPLTIASFGYNTATTLPSRIMPIADYWGYCNATAPTPGFDIANTNRNANAATVQADILTSVSDIEGGAWQLSYEPNSNSGGPAIDGVRVNQITQVLPTGNLIRTYKYVDINGNASGQIMSAQYQTLSFQLGTGFIDLSSSPFVVNDVNGNSLGYSHVKVTDPDGGYTFYSFSNFSDVADADGIGFNDAFVVNWTNGANPFPLLVQSDDLSAKRGLLKDVSVYKSNGDPVTETAYTSAPQNTTVIKDGYGIRGFTYSVGGNSMSANNIYYTPIENYRLIKTVRTDYDQANPTTATPLITTTNYTYDPLDNRLVLQVSAIDSKGQTHTQTLYHAGDIANVAPSPNVIPMITTPETNAINAMVGGNNTSVVIHSIDNRNSTISQMHNAYGIMLNGAVTQVYPVNSANYSNDPVNTTATITKQAFYSYDPVYSNLISSNLIGDIFVSAQYLYHASLPVARVTNAAVNEFFYQGFEESGGNISTSAHTGNMSFGGSYTVPFTVPNGRSYLIQWWSYSGSWVFNQQAYTGPVALSGQIDDIRVFPKDALMTTCTYNPLVGKTSETDPSGRSVLNIYDGLNRLLTVLDQDGNVLKQYDYKYQFLPSNGTTGLVLTGVPGYSSGGPTVGQGTISGPPGYLVTVTMNASGSPGHPCGLNVQITGAVSNGPTSVTNSTASFTFIMPASGMVSWQASLVPTGPGGGSFSIH